MGRNGIIGPHLAARRGMRRYSQHWEAAKGSAWLWSGRGNCRREER